MVNPRTTGVFTSQSSQFLVMRTFRFRWMLLDLPDLAEGLERRLDGQAKLQCARDARECAIKFSVGLNNHWLAKYTVVSIKMSRIAQIASTILRALHSHENRRSAASQPNDTARAAIGEIIARSPKGAELIVVPQDWALSSCIAFSRSYRFWSTRVLRVLKQIISRQSSPI